VRTWVGGVRVRSPTARRSPKSWRKRRVRLALRVLRCAASLAQTDFLPLNFARIARHETGLSQGRAQ